jgi:hypothetical protein
MSAPPTKAPAPSRPTRFIVLAVLNIVFAVVAMVWTGILVAGLAFATAAGSSAAGMATVFTVAALNGAKILSLVAGAIGLVRSARWGWYATVAYGLLAVGEAVILYSTGASLLLVTIGLLYPVTALILLTAPAARSAAGVR